MRTTRFAGLGLIAGLALLGLAGCDGGGSCQDDCTLGTQSCEGRTLLTCGDYDTDACLEWDEGFTCPGECQVDHCVQSCQDDCISGARECVGLQFRVCGNTDSDTCTEWGQPQDCPTGETCQAGQCAGECPNPCPGAGQRECIAGVPNQYHECACVGGCCQWGAAQTCPGTESCSNGQCASCSDDCSPQGARRCDGTTGVQTCGNADADPCNEWGATTPCEGGQECRNGTCTAPCSEDCTGTGARSCTADNRAFQVCGNYDADACLELGPATACAPSEVCNTGVCVFQCNDECTAGEKRCAGSGYQLCGQFDTDPCTDWSPVSDCKQNETCSNGVCAVTCQDECAADGDRECSGFQGIRTCGQFDHDACLDLGAPESCNLWERCLDVGGPAECVIICFNDCEPIDARQCVGDGYQVCGDYDWDACLEWSDVSACAAGQLCSGGNCTTSPCQDDCSPAGESECYQTYSVRTCGQHDSDSCLDWSAAVACGSGFTCQAGACVPSCQDECDPGEVGCSDGSTRWSCSDADGDGCLDQVEAACPGGQPCVAGACDSGCNDDDMEENDSPVLAWILDEETVNGTICPDDSDWFWVIVPAGQGLRATLTFNGFDADLDLELYADTDTTTPIWVSAGISNSEVVIAEAVASEEAYYLRAAGYAGATGAYALEIELVGAGECFDDYLEENDAQADPMFILDGSYPGLQVCAGDEDYYEHYMFAGETLSTSIAFSHALGDLDMELLDEQGASLDSSNSSNDMEDVSWSVLEEGLYYVRVFGYGGAENGYEMTVSYGGAGCSDDAYEPNDAQGEAPELFGGTYDDLQMCANDEDWFAVYVFEGEDLLVSITFANAAGDLDLRLVDEAGSVVDFSTSSSADTETVGGFGLMQGFYYVRVNGYQGAENPYTMEIVID